MKYTTWDVPEIGEDLVGRVEAAAAMLHDGSGDGAQYRGWLTLPTDYDEDEYTRIQSAAQRVQADGDIFITIGIGGSYLGAKAVTHAMSNIFTGVRTAGGKVEMLYAGNQLSSAYLQELLDYIKNKSVYLNIISKSGTTLEPALTFKVLRAALEERYGEDGARERIFATTDKERGVLKDLAGKKGYETFIVPDDVGGRYSVLTAVGLLPIAVAGISIDDLMQGAADAAERYSAPYGDNACYQYAAVRNALYESGKKIEILVGYEPKLQYFSEWWKQLFGESEGKDGKGLYPASMQFTTDLHSLGQYVQEGERHVFETVIDIEDPGAEIDIVQESGDADGLNYLAGKTMHEANTAAREGTRAAHRAGNVPQIALTLERLDAYNIGHLIYFYEKACAVSAYTMGVNPFNQPGVEAYKKEMFSLLGK